MKSKGKQVLRPTLNSERSPSVHYANWKETMLLKKQLSTLHRTEHGLLHRITVDQKVMFRRFQVKLQRSKIAHARLWGYRGLEKELRSSGMRSLHSESHLVHGADDEFLSKLEHRPYCVEKEKKDQDAQKTPNSVNAQLEDDDVTQDDLKNLVRFVMNEQPISNTRHNLRSLSTLGNIMQASLTAIVPGLGKSNRINSAPDATDSTCKLYSVDLLIGQTLDKEREINPNNQTDVISLTKIVESRTNSDDVFRKKSVTEKLEPEKKHVYADGRRIQKISIDTVPISQPTLRSQSTGLKPNVMINNEGVTSSSCSLSSISGTKDDFEKQHSTQNEVQIEIPNTFRQKLQAKPRQGAHSLSLEIISPSPPSNGENSYQTAQNMRKKKTSIFEESAKPDFREQRLAIARAVDHSNLVRSFCDGLAAFGPGVPNFDYYASKMQAEAKTQVKTALLSSPPGTPDTDYRKYTGDQTIKCITLPKLKLRRADDADDSDNEYYHNPHFDNLVLSHTDRSLDADSESAQSPKN